MRTTLLYSARRLRGRYNAKACDPKQRCPESSQGRRCIHQEGHDGDHFAKCEHTYLVWSTG